MTNTNRYKNTHYLQVKVENKNHAYTVPMCGYRVLMEKKLNQHNVKLIHKPINR